jgi:hypothetical protein
MDASTVYITSQKSGAVTFLSSAELIKGIAIRCGVGVIDS